MENSRLSKSQSISRNASSHDIKSSLKDIQNEYAKALEQIEDLKTERSYLKAALNKSVDDRGNKSAYRDDSISVDQVSQTMKTSSYASKALVDSEKRVVQLEEENKELKKLVKSHRKKLLKMQEEILSYQYEVDKLGYLKVYNQDLQAEMELLDQEFNTIIKRIDVIDEVKSQTQIDQSMSIKPTKEFRQTLLKYANYITKGVNSLDLKHYLRFRFEEIFSSEAELLNLVINQEYSTLVLKMIKLVADILPNNGDNNTDQDASLNRLSPFSVGEITPQKVSVFSPANDQFWSQVPDISPQTSQMLPTSLTRGLQNSQPRDSAPSQIRFQKQSNSLPAGQNMNESQRKQRETQSSLSFGTRESKPQSIDMKAESPRSSRSQHDSIQKLDVSPIERPTHNFPELKNNTIGNGSSMYIRDDDYGRTAAELELIQREKELIQKERELMEKKKEYLMRSNQMNERDQSMMSEQRSIREKDNRSFNESPLEHGRIKSQRRLTSEAEESNARIREDDLESRRSPVQLKSILKSGSSQVIENLEKEKDSIMKRRKDDETLSIGSASNQIRSAKDMSNVLREKSRHIAKVLTKGSLYEEDLQSLKSESSMHRDSPVYLKSNKSPVNSVKNYEEEAHESLKPSRIKSSDKILQEDVESRFGSNETSLLADKKSWFYPKSPQNQSVHNQSKQSYHPPSMAQRLDSHESRKDESSNKKVSFFAQYQRTTESNNQDSVPSSQHQSRQTTQQSPLHEEDEESTQHIMNYHTARRYNEVPRGTQYASFSVAFGRTESAERDPSSPVKNFGSIIDVLMKKRCEHTHQTYDVIKGEEVFKRAVRDNGSPQYKVVAEPMSSNRRARRCFFNSESVTNVTSKPAN